MQVHSLEIHINLGSVVYSRTSGTLTFTLSNFWMAIVFWMVIGYLSTASTRRQKISRSSRLEVLREKGALKNFAIFTKKHLCWALL